MYDIKTNLKKNKAIVVGFLLVYGLLTIACLAIALKN